MGSAIIVFCGSDRAREMCIMLCVSRGLLISFM